MTTRSATPATCACPADPDGTSDPSSLTWKLATNEDGWRCLDCGRPLPSVPAGDPPGYRPDLDREHVETKAGAILAALHDADFIHVSNSDHGDNIAANVARRCRRSGRFDQYTIIAEIMGQLDSHGDYWKRIGDGVTAGADPRERCGHAGCGRLATSFVVGGRKTCAEHRGPLFGAAEAEGEGEGETP